MLGLWLLVCALILAALGMAGDLILALVLIAVIIKDLVVLMKYKKK